MTLAGKRQSSRFNSRGCIHIDDGFDPPEVNPPGPPVLSSIPPLPVPLLACLELPAVLADLAALLGRLLQMRTDELSRALLPASVWACAISQINHWYSEAIGKAILAANHHAVYADAC